MKLEVGMHVRTEYGEIFKITNIRKYKTKKDEYCFDKILDRHEDRACNDNLLYEDELDEITKASYNIIDLIEEGDYVNGAYVEKDNLGNLGYTFIDGDGYPYFSLIGKISNKPKSIVTKEQFEKMEYRVDE